ncbi:hypothetical protein KO465_08350 [Candidatus Micrarchaeota archaeon]|jgi:hypothetical protein|nr:hypothetical protein [Candidatus Micrarchaeota archaeon]
MAKSKLIKELANNEISLEIALNRIIIIAADIDNPKLTQWAERELNGYAYEDDLPSYRIAKGATILYSGLSGYITITNAKLAIYNLFDTNNPKEKEMLDLIMNRKICEGIATVEKAANDSNSSRSYDLMFIAGLVLAKTGVQCTSISQSVSSVVYENIVNNLKTTILKILLELDKSFDGLDELDIDISTKSDEDVENVNKIINNYIYIGDNNSIKGTTIDATGENNRDGFE